VCKWRLLLRSAYLNILWSFFQPQTFPPYETCRWSIPCYFFIYWPRKRAILPLNPFNYALQFLAATVHNVIPGYANEFTRGNLLREWYRDQNNAGCLTDCETMRITPVIQWFLDGSVRLGVFYNPFMGWGRHGRPLQTIQLRTASHGLRYHILGAAPRIASSSPVGPPVSCQDGRDCILLFMELL